MQHTHAPRFYNGTGSERGLLVPDQTPSFFFDTDENVMYWWDGTNWQSMAPVQSGVYFLHE